MKKLGVKKPKSFTGPPSRVDEEPAILLDNIDRITKELKEAFDKDLNFFYR